MAAANEANYLQLAQSLAGLRSKLRFRAETLDVGAASRNPAIVSERCPGHSALRNSLLPQHVQEQFQAPQQRIVH
jgi:hypothetical protein